MCLVFYLKTGITVEMLSVLCQSNLCARWYLHLEDADVLLHGRTQLIGEERVDNSLFKMFQEQTSPDKEIKKDQNKNVTSAKKYDLKKKKRDKTFKTNFDFIRIWLSKGIAQSMKWGKSEREFTWTCTMPLFNFPAAKFLAWC